MQKKVTYVISDIDKALAFEWIATHLDKDKFKLEFILLNKGDSVLENFLKSHNVAVKRIGYQGKKDLPMAFIKIARHFIFNRPDVVHAHLFHACMAGLAAAKFCRVKKRIHTRHHSTFHHVYHPHTVKYDRFVNYLSTDIVAISPVVAELLEREEKVSREKIHLVPHGFVLDDFANVPENEVTELKLKYNPRNEYPVVGVIARFTELKGIQYIIPAFRKLLSAYPDALLILANAVGSYTEQIQQQLSGLPERNYLQIRFENNVFALYKLFDVFVHVPIEKYYEAFGQTYVEALASGIPSVFTLSGIANEFITDRHNALVVPYRDSDAIHSAILELLSNKQLATQLSQNGRVGLEEKFGLKNMISSFEKLYLA